MQKFGHKNLSFFFLHGKPGWSNAGRYLRHSWRRQVHAGVRRVREQRDFISSKVERILLEPQKRFPSFGIT